MRHNRLRGVVKMFEHLNARTRKIISDLISGKRVSVGANTFGPFESDERLMLFVISSHLLTLKEVKGSQLATDLASLFTAAQIAEIADAPGDLSNSRASVAWNVGQVRASSYRGLAPAGQTWEHDFNGECHLLHGPNGCGKSSLLGAIAWCLTGQIFRDDCPPCAPSNVDTYTAGENPRKASARPDV